MFSGRYLLSVKSIWLCHKVIPKKNIYLSPNHFIASQPHKVCHNEGGNISYRVRTQIIFEIFTQPGTVINILLLIKKIKEKH